MKRGLQAVLALTVVLAACEKRTDEIKVYRLEKAPLEQAPAAAGDSMPMAGDLPPSHPPINTAPVTSASVSAVTAPSAGVPATWETQPLSEMRKASYIVHGPDGSSADISFVALGPSAGNVLDNVNRWLNQLGQPPITDAQLREVVQNMPSELGHVAVVDLQGLPEQGDPKKDGRILAAIATGDGATSFYKMRGNNALVAGEKDNFLKWVTAMRASR